jgi:hypothetical protein
MATIKVATLIETAGIILQDASQVRFPQAELMTFLNDAQREIVLHRPDSKTVNASVTCVAGSKQSLPSTGLRLVDVVRNDGGRAITQIARKILDETLPLTRSRRLNTLFTTRQTQKASTCIQMPLRAWISKSFTALLLLTSPTAAA